MPKRTRSPSSSPTPVRRNPLSTPAGVDETAPSQYSAAPDITTPTPVIAGELQVSQGSQLVTSSSRGSSSAMIFHNTPRSRNLPRTDEQLEDAIHSSLQPNANPSDVQHMIEMLIQVQVRLATTHASSALEYAHLLQQLFNVALHGDYLSVGLQAWRAVTIVTNALDPGSLGWPSLQRVRNISRMLFRVIERWESEFGVANLSSSSDQAQSDVSITSSDSDTTSQSRSIDRQVTTDVTAAAAAVQQQPHTHTHTEPPPPVPRTSISRLLARHAEWRAAHGIPSLGEHVAQRSDTTTDTQLTLPSLGHSSTGPLPPLRLHLHNLAQMQPPAPPANMIRSNVFGRSSYYGPVSEATPTGRFIPAESAVAGPSMRPINASEAVRAGFGFLEDDSYEGSTRVSESGESQLSESEAPRASTTRSKGKAPLKAKRTSKNRRATRSGARGKATASSSVSKAASASGTAGARAIKKKKHGNQGNSTVHNKPGYAAAENESILRQYLEQPKIPHHERVANHLRDTGVERSYHAIRQQHKKLMRTQPQPPLQPGSEEDEEVEEEEDEEMED